MKINIFNQCAYWVGACGIFAGVIIFGVVLKIENIELFVIPFSVCLVVANLFVVWGMVTPYDKLEKNLKLR